MRFAEHPTGFAPQVILILLHLLLELRNELKVKNKRTKKLKLFQPSYSNLTEEQISRIREMTPSDTVVKVWNKGICNPFKRNNWVKIKNDKQVIYRIVRGAVVTGLTADQIWMSYDSQLELGLSTEKDREVELRVSSANMFERYILAPWNTPNPVERNLYRVATALGFISVLLGLIGLLV